MNHDPVLLAQVAAQYPNLIHRTDPPSMSGQALAAKNLRRLLKARFPATRFSITSEAFSMGTAVRVSWEGWDGAPTSQEVDGLAEMFCFSTYDGQTDSTESKREPGGMAFRSLFGSTKHVSTRREPISEEMMAQRLAVALPEAASASAKRRPRL